MPRCTICGKKFATLSALQEHHRAVHPKTKFAAPYVSLTRNLFIIIVAILIATSIGVAYLIYNQYTSPNSGGSGGANGLLLTPISPELYKNMTQVSLSTLASVGTGMGNPPTAISSSSLSVSGKPEFLSITAEFCPHCAAERWAIVVALSKFGNWTNLEYMLSAPDDGNISTVTFRNATYTSQYLVFISVENEDRNQNLLQSTTTQEQQLWDQYNPGTYPFIDIGGKYDLTRPQFSFQDIQGMSWTQIASQLNNPSSTIAKLIDGSANYLISAICKIDGGNPSSLCGQSFAQLLSFQPGATPSSSNFFLSLTQASPIERNEMIASPRVL
jgi:hypothetical protein